jgi:hypothetical protein
MVILHSKNLKDELSKLGSYNYHKFNDKKRAKWKIVNLLNDKYNLSFDLHNWINYNDNDEVAYFLNEAYSNAESYSKWVKFHLWVSEKGFIIGVEHQDGFNASEVAELGVRENEGAGFRFFKNCKSQIFFDDAEKAKVIYMDFKL